MLFSAERVRAKGSNFLSNVPPDAKFVKVDDYTVDVMLDAPNPILISQWDGWFIMDKKWCAGARRGRSDAGVRDHAELCHAA